jgi:hypothetical protein
MGGLPSTSLGNSRTAVSTPTSRLWRVKCANNPSGAMQLVFATRTRDVDLRGLVSPALVDHEVSRGGVKKAPESP